MHDATPDQGGVGVKASWLAGAFANPAKLSCQEMQSSYDTGAAITAASRAVLSWHVEQLFM